MPNLTKKTISFLLSEEIVRKKWSKKEGLIANNFAILKLISETICLEILKAKRNWCIAFVYRPSYNKKKSIFFNKYINLLDKMI